MYTNLLQRAFSIVGGARQVLTFSEKTIRVRVNFLYDRLQSSLLLFVAKFNIFIDVFLWGGKPHTGESSITISRGVMVEGNRATTCFISPSGFRMTHTSLQYASTTTLSDPVPGSRNRKNLTNSWTATVPPPALQASGSPRAQAEPRPDPIVRPLFLRPLPIVPLCHRTKPVAIRNPTWHPHLDTQQRFAVVVCPVLALRIMQLLRLAGAGHRGVQQRQQQPQRRGPWAQPHRSRPARTRRAARRETGGARAWQPCFTGGHRGAALLVGGGGRGVSGGGQGSTNPA